MTHSKDALRDMLANATERFTRNGYEIVRYAADVCAEDRLKRATERRKKAVNLKDVAYQEYLQQVEAGTYAPLTSEPKQERFVPRAKNVRLDEIRI